MTSLIFDVIGCLYPKDHECLFVANRYSSTNCIKDKSIWTCADVTHLFLMFENLRLTLAKKRCECECNKTIISENFCVFPFVKTLGFYLKVFAFKLNQNHICQTTIIEKHLRRYYVRMNSMRANHGPICKRIKMIKRTSSNQSCGRDRECKMVRF